MKQTYRPAVAHGDGIGQEVSKTALGALEAALGPERPLEFLEYPAGAQHFLETGESFPEASFGVCRGSGSILYGAAGIPGIVHPDGVEASLDFTLSLCFRLDLYANVPPSSSIPACLRRCAASRPATSTM